MNLRNLSDQVLQTKTENLAQQEREILTELLHHLSEIETRRLYSALGFKSLFDYAVKKLSYSADQAARRISAMRLMKELPEIEAKIETGELTLTNLSLAHSLFRKEEASRSDKIDVLKELENKSTRDAEKIILSRASEPTLLRHDRTRVVAGHKIEICFIADERLGEKLEKVRGLLAHSNPNCTMAELIEKLCDLSIEKLSPAHQVRKTRNRAARLSNPTSHAPVNLSKECSEPTVPALSLEPAIPSTKSFTAFEQDVDSKPGAPRGHCVRAEAKTSKTCARSRQISRVLRRTIWQRDQGKCSNCDSSYALEIDHLQPKSLGGSDHIENLRLLCRSCNQRAAIEELGLAKMRAHFET